MQRPRLLSMVGILAALLMIPWYGASAQSTSPGITTVRLSTPSNMIDKTDDAETGVSTLVTTGGDPYIFTTKLGEELTEDQTVLAFDYICSTGIPDMQTFFPDPLSEPNSIHYSLPAASDWTTFKLDISSYRIQSGWGKATDYLRMDFGGSANRTIQIKNIRIQTTNASESEGKDSLEIYLNKMPFGVEDYVYGKYVGQIGDEKAYSDFFDAYSTAIQVSGNESSTDEQKKEALEKLKTTYAAAEAATNEIKDSTYYYIQTAYSAFAGKDTMAWFAPRSGAEPGWKKQQPSLAFFWTITPQKDGTYLMRNALTGQYIKSTAKINTADSPLVMSDKEAKQKFTLLSPTGQFTIRSAKATWLYNIQGHNSGNGTEGPIASWVATNISGETAWKLLPVSAADIAAAKTTENFDKLNGAVESFDASSYKIGTDPGMYSEASYNALLAEITAARDLLDSTSAIPNEENCKAEYDKLAAAKQAFIASLVTVTDGYYSISQIPYSDKIAGKSGYAFVAKGDNDWLYSSIWDSGNPAYIWKITDAGKGRFYIQNVVSKKYVNSSDLIAESASINLSSSPTTPQIISAKGDATFSFSNTDVAALNLTYGYNADELVFFTKSADIASGQSMYLHKYTEKEVDSIATAYPNILRTDTLKSLIDVATATIDPDTIYTLDLTSPVVTDASQFYSNNKSNEGSYDAMIDNNFDTFFITAWDNIASPEKAYHYLRVDAGEGKTLPTTFGMHWRTRGSNWSNMYRPVDVIYSVSDDAVNWVDLGEVKNPAAGFPTTADVPEFTSTTPVKTSKPYRYFKFTVLKTNNNSLGPTGYPYFNFSEFNLYPMSGVANPALDDEDLKQAVSSLKSAVAEAQKTLESGTVASSDIKALRDAYKAFLLVHKDTTDLYAIYKKSTGATDNIETGEDLFCYPDGKVEAFEAAWAEVDAARPFSSIDKQTEVARLDTLLTNAYYDLINSMIGPDPDKWYNILSADTADSYDGSPILGQVAWVGGLTSVDGFAAGDKWANKETDLRTSWRFEPTSTPNVYYMINCASAWPINRGPVKLQPLGEGQFAILTGQDLNQAFYINMIKFPGIPATLDPPHKSGNSAWTMQETPTEYTSTLTMPKGSFIILCLPYDTYEMPVSLTEGETVTAYEVCGYDLAEDGKTVKYINLTEMAGDDRFADGIPAGTPFVLSYGDHYVDSVNVTADLMAKVGGNVSRTLSINNGTYGTFSKVSLPAGMIYLNKDSAYVEDKNFDVTPQSGYININSIKINPDVSVDKQIPVVGNAELSTAIKAIVSADASTVDVYSADGILIKHGVKASDAAKGLKKGVYIIGKKKVLVK